MEKLGVSFVGLSVCKESFTYDVGVKALFLYLLSYSEKRE